MHNQLVVRATGLALCALFNLACAGIQAEDANALISRAQTQHDNKQYSAAEISYKKALTIDPLDTRAITGMIELYRKQGMAAKVQLFIAQLSAEQRAALGGGLKRIEATMLQDQADLRIAKGQDDQAIKYLEQAVQVDADDPWLHFKLANQYARRGSISMGLTLLENFATGHPGNTDALYALALYQSDRGDTGNALKNLNRIESEKRSPDMNLLYQRLSVKNLGPASKSLMQTGNKSAAQKMLADAEVASPGNIELTLAVAFAWAEIGEVERGRALFEKVKTDQTFDGLDNDARSGLIKILISSDKHAEAIQQLDAWASSPTANDIPVGSHLADLYLDIGEYGRAKQQIDTLLAMHPEASYVLYDAWKMAQRAGQLDDEIDYLKKLVIAEPSIQTLPGEATPPTKPLAYEAVGIDEFGSINKIQRDWKEKKLAALIDRRSRWFSSAMDIRNRSGTAGLSEFHSVEIPLEYKAPWHSDDEVFFRADLIRLNAGSVAPTNRDFGSMQLCQPSCTAASFNQQVQGVSFTAGYQRDDFGADIGTTPRSFAVANIVGGIQHKGDLGPFGYSIETSRRPITASFLSYAGSMDPNTGKIWGGVVASGARVGLSLDGGNTFGFWSSAGLHSLTGRNVQTNRRVQLMAGEQWRMINEENRRFVLGLTGMYWDFSENAGEYSFGHGGYYSPHNYRSLSLPVTYTARSPRFSYLLRAAVSASYSQTRAALLYPTDSALQTQAESLRASTPPSYSGGWGYGQGYSLSAGGEYQIEPQLFVGGLLSLDKTASYSPNQILIYLRYSLDHAGARPVYLPPEPVEASSQFY